MNQPSGVPVLAGAAADSAAEVQALTDEALFEIWLHAGWRWLTARMRSNVKEAFADAVDRQGTVLSAAEGDDWTPVERWWRDEAVSGSAAAQASQP